MFRVTPEASELIDSLVETAIVWAEAQRNTFRDGAFTLPQPERELISPFFCEETLEKVRFRHVGKIENPDFLGFLKATVAGDTPIDFSQMAGITFVDTIILSDAYFEEHDLLSLLFHECVHVVQFDQLGVEGFMRRYIEGRVANRMDYFAIPLERDAYELERQFRFQPHRPFYVEDAVALRLKF